MWPFTDSKFSSTTGQDDPHVKAFSGDVKTKGKLHCWSRSSPGTAHWELFQTGGCVLSLMLLHLHCARTRVLGFDLSRSHHQVQPDMPLTKCLSHHIPTPFCLCVGMSDGVPEPQGRALAGTQSTQFRHKAKPGWQWQTHGHHIPFHLRSMPISWKNTRWDEFLR